MLSKTKAIVLHYIKYGSSSIIVTFYTEAFGRISCIVNSVRKKNAKLHANLFQHLHLLEIDIFYRQNREIHGIKDVVHSFQYKSIPFDAHKRTIALFIAEVLYLTLREEESNPSLYAFIQQSLLSFDDQQEEIHDFHLWFLLQLSGFLGIHPHFELNDQVSETDPDTKIFRGLPAEVYEILRILLVSEHQPPQNLHITNTIRSLILERLIQYYTEHISGFSHIRSYSILKDIYK